MKFEADAILFDIDGTLVDSTPAVIRTWTAFAEQRSLDSEEILRVSHGRRTEDTLADLLPMSEVAAATELMEELELADLDDIVALPGVDAVLRNLAAERWAAVTSGSRRLMRARLQAFKQLASPYPRCLSEPRTSSEASPTRKGTSLLPPRWVPIRPGA